MNWIKANPGIAIAVTIVATVLVYNWYVKMQAKKKAAAAAAVAPPTAG